MNSSENALEQLINQFAQPLAFLRELIQNSLDASTTQIDVEVDFDQDSGCCFVRVSDNGHGMDRNVIDNRLTKLFASTKEDDLTKIGKFGIGFVSVFAIKPELVVLETGQHGESWRILFLPDRSFERREMNTPIDGTSVTVFVRKTRNDLRRFQQDCRETVSYWCKHSDIEINFNGESINEKFVLPEVPYQYRYQVEGTEVVVAPVFQKIAFNGYYNRGLTLMEGIGSPLPHIAFKLRSRYLEHTLSRDNIKRDESYEKAMAIVRKAVSREMPVDFFARLAARDRSELWELALLLVKQDKSLTSAMKGHALFPTGTGKISLDKLPPKLYFSEERGPLWEEVEKEGETVLCLPSLQDVRLQILSELGFEVLPLEESFFHYRSVQDIGRDEQDLLSTLRKATGQFFKSPFLMETLHCPRWWGEKLSGYLHPAKRISKDLARDQGWTDAVGIRRDHPYWATVLSLYPKRPELAVFLLVRLINLELDVNRKREAKLLQNLITSVRKKAEK